MFTVSGHSNLPPQFMKYIFPLFIAGCIVAHGASAQHFNAIDNYLNNAQVSENAKNFYNEGLSLADKAQATDILDSMYTTNNATRPFYLYLACRMTENTDRKTAKYIGKRVAAYTRCCPDNVMAFLTTGTKDVPTSYTDRWAGIIAASLPENEACGTADKRISAMKRDARLRCKSFYRDELDDLILKVRSKVWENRAIDAVETVTEIAEKIKSVQAGKGDMSLGVCRGPNKQSEYFWVKVWTAKEDKPTYNFYVDPETMEVYYYDEPNDRVMNLDTWRAKLH
jgi:hypothetical protein